MPLGGSSGLNSHGLHDTFHNPFEPAPLIDGTQSIPLEGASTTPETTGTVSGGEAFVVFHQLPGLLLPHNGPGTSAPNPVTGASGGSGFHINLNFDSAALAAPQAFRDGIQAAADILEAALSDNITLNLAIHYSGTGGGAFAGPSGGVFATYSSVRAALVGNASPGDHTFDSLPSGTSIGGKSNVAVWAAQEKVFGIIAADDPGSDGDATFATDINSNALVGVALHELTHAMGRVPYDPQPDILEFFRFTSAGNYLFDGGVPASASSYFSLDGGNTDLADYGVNSDPSDFLNGGVQGADDPFNEFYTPGFTFQNLTTFDLIQLVALGFHLNTFSGPDFTATGATLTSSSFSVSINNEGSDRADPSTTGLYLSADNTIETSDLLLADIATGAIAAGNHRTKSATLSFSGAQTPGTYFIGVLADRNGAIGETDEGNNASNVIKVILGNNSGNSITGTTGDDHIFGLAGADIINSKGGNDMVDAGDGNDTINMATFFSASDRIDGGADTDTLKLTGDYSGGVTFGTNTVRHVEKILLGAGFDYRLTPHDTTVNSGQNMTVDATALTSDNKFTFDGSAETNGSFTLLGGDGDDSMTGGAGPDTMTGNDGADSFRPGSGSDIVSGGAGNDTVRFNPPGTLNAGDKIDGGADTDTVFVTGDYSAGVTFNATTMTNVERLVLSTGFSYRFTTNDATIAAGQTLTIDDTAVGAGNTVLIKGSAETDGQFKFMAGAAVEDFTGGTMADTFLYTAASQSTGSTYDRIHAFNFTNDVFNTPGAAGTITGIDTMLTTGMLDDGANFDTELHSALTGHLVGHHAMLFKADSGTLMNQTFLVVDVNGTAGYQAGADLVFHMLNATGTLATTNFV